LRINNKCFLVTGLGSLTPRPNPQPGRPECLFYVSSPSQRVRLEWLYYKLGCPGVASVFSDAIVTLTDCLADRRTD